MTVITIRNVPEQVNAKLKRQAQARGQSLQQFLLRELEAAAERSPLEEQLREVLDQLPQLNLSHEEVLTILDEARGDRIE